MADELSIHLRQIRWRQRAKVFTTCILLIAALPLAFFIAMHDYARVHQSETSIAAHIIGLGGSYNIDRSNDRRHIVGVWLEDTGTTDADVDAVLQLPFLTHLNLTNTQITDASIDAISKHGRIKLIRVGGTAVTNKRLRQLYEESTIGLDE